VIAIGLYFFLVAQIKLGGLELRTSNGSLNWSELESKKFILAPFFSHCGATCSVLIPELRNALSEEGIDWQVLAVSMDSEDDASDFEDFRNRFSLPKTWIFASGSGLQLKQLFTKLDFGYQETSPRQFVHPAILYIFDPGLELSAQLMGLNVRKELRSISARKLPPWIVGILLVLCLSASCGLVVFLLSKLKAR